MPEATNLDFVPLDFRASPFTQVGDRNDESASHVFIDTEGRGPKRIVAEVGKIPGVVRADALFGAPDVVVVVDGG